MSEVIASIDPKMPAGYEKLDGLEVVKQKDGSLRYNGIIELGEGDNSFERKVQLPDPLEIWGHDPQEWEKYNSNPDFWEMARKLGEVVTELHELAKQVADLKRENAELHAENRRLHDEIDQLRNNPPIPLAEPSPEPIPAAEPESTPPAPETVVTEAIPTPPEPDVPEADVDLESQAVERRGLRRITGRIGDFILGRQVALQSGVYTLIDRRGRRMVVDEPVAETYYESSDRAGAAVVGGLAVGALLGGVAAWLIWGRHTGHNVSVNTSTVNEHFGNGSGNKLIVDHTTVSSSFVSDNLSAGSGHRHVDFFNNAPGHRRTGVENPASLRLSTDSAGHYEIVNNKGQTVVRHSDLPSGIADRQGNLSQKARSILKSRGYVLTQGKLGTHYMTEVWKR